MGHRHRHPLISGALVTGLGTLLSRLLGMVRDMATASILGMAGSPVMDAFVVAYRIPNLFRRLFGEGALTASYLPVLSAELERDRRRAWQLASVMLTWVTVLLAALVGLGELLLLAAWWFWGDLPGMTLLLGLSATLLPYLLFICLAAQLSATLHAMRHFAMPALAPVVLNLCWLAAAWWICPYLTPNQPAQAYAIAGSVLVAGVLQVAVQVPVLLRMGFRFHYDWPAAREGMRRVGGTLTPMLFGLAITQVNTFFDSVIAWGMARAPHGPERIHWLGDIVRYPLDQGAASALYYGERLYHFPLGVLGLAVASAIFPLLSRHAARGDRDALGADLSLGLRLVACLGVPAGAGLVLLAHPLVQLLFERGQFTPDDTIRAARVIAAYGLGVWAFCAVPVAVRGFYSLGDSGTPVRIGVGAMFLNLALNLALIWPLAERGLAIATSISASVQVLVLLLVFSRRASRLDWPELAATAARALASTAVMTAVCLVLLALVPPAKGLGTELARVFLPMTVGGAAYAVVFRLLGGRELWQLVRRV
ncbi:MAG: murein biosynthesis integral membrane protein MurJ [Patescibacteria group bacterium]|nr:murein biosynthesis integral membrane protein MurJ [Patescibacteria group bacterium]